MTEIVCGPPAHRLSRRNPARTAALLAGIGLLAVAAMPLAASADPAFTTGSVNMRTGPGTNYPKITTLPGNLRVDVLGCRNGWCQVSAGGPPGWISSNYIDSADAPPAYRPPPPIYREPPPVIYVEPDYPDYGPGPGWGPPPPRYGHGYPPPPPGYGRPGGPPPPGYGRPGGPPPPGYGRPGGPPPPGYGNNPGRPGGPGGPPPPGYGQPGGPGPAPGAGQRPPPVMQPPPPGPAPGGPPRGPQKKGMFGVDPNAKCVPMPGNACP